MRMRWGSAVKNQGRSRLLSAAAMSVAACATIAVVLGVLLGVLGGSARSAQDKYTVQVPNGLAFSEFRGYEDWQTIAVSQAGDLIEVIGPALPATASPSPTAP